MRVDEPRQDEDVIPELAVYCPECTEREFGAA
jgi:hypothetical protein